MTEKTSILNFESLLN